MFVEGSATRGFKPGLVKDGNTIRACVAAMSSSHIVKDEATGVTYMDTMTTLVGWVTLSGPKQEP